jgi:hypothetical protein
LPTKGCGSRYKLLHSFPTDTVQVNIYIRGKKSLEIIISEERDFLSFYPPTMHPDQNDPQDIVPDKAGL